MNEVIEYVQSIPYFPPDSCAWGHAVLGFGVGFLDPWAQFLGATAFVMYECLRDKPTKEKIGGVAEFVTGYLVQKVAFGGKV